MEADELRRLRARAYGPDADIASDPAALARLEELEAARRAPEPVAPTAAASAAAAVSIEPATPAEPSDANHSLDDIPPVDDAPAPAPSVAARGWRGWSRRRAAVVGAVVLVLAVVVAVGTTSFVTRRTGYAAPVTEVLLPVPGREVPPVFGATQDNSHVYADFAGFTPISSSSLWNGAQATDCLSLIESEYIDEASSNVFRGAMHFGCAAGPFPATIEFVVTREMPQSMRDRYPEGTALQFVLEDDEVVVLESPPQNPPT